MPGKNWRSRCICWDGSRFEYALLTDFSHGKARMGVKIVLLFMIRGPLIVLRNNDEA